MKSFELIPQLGLWWAAHMKLALVVLAGLGVLAVIAQVCSQRRTPALTTHGSARWSTRRERREAHLSTQHGVVVGEIDGVIYCEDGPTHVALFGPTRSMKGYGHIRPTLQWFWRDSALILDPKNGENYQACRAERQALGRVEVFAPTGRPQCCLNVCDSIHWHEPREFDDALHIGQSLTAPRLMAKESEVSLHFRELAAMLLAATQLHLGYTTGGCHLPLVWQFLTQRPGKTKGQRLLETLDLMGSTAHVAGGVHQAIVSITNAILAISGDRELGSIWSTAIRPLILYNGPFVAASTATSTFDLRDLQHGPEPASLFLVAPSPQVAKRLYPVYRVVLDVALSRLMERQGKAKPADYQHRVLVVCDELPAYGYIPTLNDEVSTMAGYGIKGFFVAQDIYQFERTYGPDNDIWGNAHCKLFHAPDNDTTAERISAMLGTGTVEYEVRSRGGGMGGRGTSTPHRTGRAVLLPDEVQAMAPGLGIAVLSGEGLRPFQFTKCGYDPQYQEDKAYG
jgi:type IV secretion system protein VirD4